MEPSTIGACPNVRELHSLIHFGFVGPALANTAGTGPWTEGDAFSGVQSGDYWSSTSRPDLQESAWLVILGDGRTDVLSHEGARFVWPVRGEH